jgi:CheY-like chemotaxis protein
LELRFPDHPLRLQCDVTRIAQVLGNLLHNASKFTPAGGKVLVSLSEDQVTRTAVVKVLDTGAGLREVDLARLFEPFIQADQSLARVHGGLGLGLALAKRLMELHGGSIEAESAGLGHGSTFTLRLPMTMHDEVEPSQEKTSSSSTAARKLNILIVEDNEDAAKSMLLLIKLLGHKGEAAFDGQAGVKAAQDNQPDVIISDLGLPGEFNGYDLARQIRANSRFSSTLLVALSGYGQEEDRKKAKEAGFDQHYVKPIDIGSLEEILLAVQQRLR